MRTAPEAPPALYVSWGENVREARLQAGLTQVELAQHIGATQWTVCRLEKGDHRPADSLRIALSNVLRTPVEELFPYPKPTVAA
jgi:putative transcriptional regulator